MGLEGGAAYRRVRGSPGRNIIHFKHIRELEEENDE
jgi:hypothetical protein